MATGTITDTVFSEYEIRELAIKFPEDEAVTHADCVGTWEDEAEVKVITKNCRGSVVKRRVKPTGNGTVTASAHWPEAILAKMYDMVRDELVAGVQGYGRDNSHKEFQATLKVLDEDGNVAYLAYPKMVANNKSTSTENGAEEVSEREIELAYAPDENGYGMYKVLEKDLASDTAGLKTKWMSDWTPELMLAGV